MGDITVDLVNEGMVQIRSMTSAWRHVLVDRHFFIRKVALVIVGVVFKSGLSGLLRPLLLYSLIFLFLRLLEVQRLSVSSKTHCFLLVFQ